MMGVKEFFCKNKKKILILGSLFGGFVYFGIRNYEVSKNVCFGIYNFVKNVYNGNLIDNYEEKFQYNQKNEYQFKSFCFKLIEDKLKISEIKNNIQIKKDKELIYIWEIFKNKTLISFYSYNIILKFLSLISLTNISLMNKLIEKQMINYSNSLEILKEIWEYIENSCKVLLEKIEKFLSDKVENILLKGKLKFENLNNLLLQLLENILKNIQLNNDYLDKIEKQIYELDSKDYDINNSLNEIIDDKLKFYSIYFDIINSDFFQLTIQEIIREEINNNLLSIKEKIQNEEKSMAQIILLLDEIRISNIEQININEEINNQCSLDSISEEYIKTISNIF